MHNILCLFYSDLYSFPLSPKTKGEFFSDPHCDNLVVLLEIKPTKVCLLCVPSSHTHQHSGFSSLSKLLLPVYTALVASVPGKQISARTLHSPVSLDFRVALCPVTSVSDGKTIDFQLFLIGMMTLMSS